MGSPNGNHGAGSGRRTSPLALLEDPDTIRARREAERESERMLPPPAAHLPAMVREAARPHREPTKEEWEQMRDALDHAMYAPADEAYEARVRATELVVRSFRIDLSHVSEIRFDPDLDQQAKTDTRTGEIRLTDSAFNYGPGGLAAILLHEVTHADQGVRRGEQDQSHPNALAYEVMAYQTAETHAELLRLDDEFLKENRENRERVLQLLHSGNRQQLEQSGEYWNLDGNLPNDPEAAALVGMATSWTTDPTRVKLLLRGDRV